MKVLKVNNKDYIIKFTSKAIQELNAHDITLIGLMNDLESMRVDRLYTAFTYGLKAMQHDITEEKALSIIDDFYEEDENNDIEKFFYLVVGEYSKAMGLGKKFKELLANKEQMTQE